MLGSYLRKKNIIDLLRESEVLSVSDLAEKLDISISTARRDINILLEDGTVEKKRGGAYSLKVDPQKNTLSDFPETDHSESVTKTLIAQKAAKTVNDGDIIFVDCGTTTGLMVRYINAKNVTVVTPSITLPQKYIPKEGVTCIVLGGEYYPELFAMNGPITESQLSVMHFNKAYLGTNAYSIEKKKTYVFDVRQAYIKKLAKKQSEKTYLLAETAKKSKISFYESFDLSNCTIIDELTEEPTQSDID